MISTTGRAVEWKRRVLAAIGEAVRGAGWEKIAAPHPVRLRLVVQFPTKDAKRHWRLRTAIRNADADNVLKLVMDALTVQDVFADDGQVADVQVIHVWVPEAHAGAAVEVSRADSGVLAWAKAAIGGDTAPDWLD